MMPDDVRAEWTALRQQINADALAAKESQGALFRLFDRYRSLSAVERPIVDELIAEQVLSPNEIDRFDAVAMVDKFVITSALPALRTLADHLEGDSKPGAPFEWAKVNRLIGKLVGASL